jgi:hypothetical protein
VECGGKGLKESSLVREESSLGREESCQGLEESSLGPEESSQGLEESSLLAVPTVVEELALAAQRREHRCDFPACDKVCIIL